MFNLNNTEVAGRIIGDVNENLIEEYNGSKFFKGTIVSNRKFKTKNGIKEKVLFLNFTLFGKYAEVFTKYVKSGDNIYLKGYIEINTSKKNGVTRSFTSLSVSDFRFANRKLENTENEENAENLENELSDINSTGEQFESDFDFADVNQVTEQSANEIIEQSDVQATEQSTSETTEQSANETTEQSDVQATVKKSKSKK